MPNAIPASTAASTTNPQGVPQGAPASKDAPISDPNAKKNEGAGTNIATPSVTAQEKAATNQGEAAVRKFKLKVDGKEMELPEHEVIARAQRSTAADQRFAEAQQTRKQAEAFVSLLKTDFTKLLDDPALGLDETAKRQMLEQYYKQKYIDPEVLTPEQRKQQENERELNQYRETEKHRKEEEHNIRLKQLEDYHAENYQKTFITALQSEGVPKTEFTVRRMADLTTKNLQLGLDLTPEHLATLVREDYQNEIKSVLGATDGDSLLKLLGDDIANKLRKADLARLRAGQPQVPAQVIETPQTNSPQTPKKFMSMDEMRDERDRKARELQASWKK